MKAPIGLMWNKAKTFLVPVGDPEGRFFYCAEGAEIPEGLPLKNMPVIPKTIRMQTKEREING